MNPYHYELHYFKQLKEKYLKTNKVNAITLNKMDIVIKRLAKKLDFCNCSICSK